MSDFKLVQAASPTSNATWIKRMLVAAFLCLVILAGMYLVLCGGWVAIERSLNADEASTTIFEAASNVLEDTGDYPASGPILVTHPDFPKPGVIEKPTPWNKYLANTPKCWGGGAFNFKRLEDSKGGFSGFQVFCGTDPTPLFQRLPGDE